MHLYKHFKIKRMSSSPSLAPLEDGSHLLHEQGDSDSSLKIENKSQLYNKFVSCIKHITPSLTVLFSATFLYFTIWLSWYLSLSSLGMPSEVVKAGNSQGFSGEISWNHTTRICQKPHMYNSDENRNVKDVIYYIIIHVSIY